MTAPEIRHYPSRDVQAKAVAAHLEADLQTLIATNGHASIAVPGGTTPGPMLEALGTSIVDWHQVVITLTDERWVPVSSPRSNARLLTETLLRGAAIAARFVPLSSREPADCADLETLCDRLEEQVLPLDIAVLGMGADMHTASMFPGAIGLADALSPDASPAIAITAPGAEEPRITLSAPVLRKADRHILIYGKDKRVALDRAVELADPTEAPICAVLDGATVHYAD